MANEVKVPLTPDQRDKIKAATGDTTPGIEESADSVEENSLREQGLREDTLRAEDVSEMGLRGDDVSEVGLRDDISEVGLRDDISEMGLKEDALRDDPGSEAE